VVEFARPLIKAIVVVLSVGRLNGSVPSFLRRTMPSSAAFSAKASDAGVETSLKVRFR
jgi:hypothetical protein